MIIDTSLFHWFFLRTFARCFAFYNCQKELLKSKDSDILELLQNIDVLVDGRYIHEKRNVDLKFRGSDNQRIIHLKNGEIDRIE